MKKTNKITMLSVIEIMFSVAWIIIALLFGRPAEGAFYFWGGVIFAIISFILTFLGLYYFSVHIDKINVEISAIPLVILCIYYGTSFVGNAFFAITYNGFPRKSVIAINLLLTVVYVSVLLYANSYIRHMEYINEQMAQRISKTDLCKVNVSNLCLMAESAKVKKELEELKQLVAYSDTMVLPWAEGKERAFNNKLDEIYSLISRGSSDEEIIASIKQAVIIWKSRNIANMNK